jgi:hypothetical protein
MDRVKLQASARRRASDNTNTLAWNRIDSRHAPSAKSRGHPGGTAPNHQRNRGRGLTIRGVGEGSGGEERGAEHRHGEEAAHRRHFDSPRTPLKPAAPVPREIPGWIEQPRARANRSRRPSNVPEASGGRPRAV